jgi:hypothetical protein
MRIIIAILVLALTGCVNDFSYRFENPDTCITVSKYSSTSCTEDQAKANRQKLFKQCNDLGGTPAIRSEESMLVSRIYGVQCLMPDGGIKDIYGEKFKQDTGQDLFN